MNRELHRRDALKLIGAGAAGIYAVYPGRRAFAADSTYELVVEQGRIVIDGISSNAKTMGGSVPAPTLRWREGEEVVIHATNRLREPTSIHWHGLLLAGVMDGAPGFNGFVAIAPGQTYTYRFRLRQSGTYWYHSHSAMQEQMGMYGAIVIAPKEGDSAADRDYVVVLSDHTREDPRRVFANLKADAGHYNRGKRTVMDFFRDASRDGFNQTMKDRAEWGEMRMDPTDLADVTGYQFLVNGKGPQDNWTGLFTPGERVRLRIINASAMSFFDVRIPGLPMTILSADGQNVQPVRVEEFRFGIGETYDVMVLPREDKAYTLFAEPIDRSGYARATLAPRQGMQGEIPKLRPRTILTMEDMGLAHGGMDHSGHGAAASGGGAMDHSKMGHGAPAAAPADTGKMDHSKMDHSKPGAAPMPGMDHSKMGHAMPGKPAAAPPDRAIGWGDAGTLPGEKALAYADLRSARKTTDLRAPTQEIEVQLNGIMERYMWNINGRPFGQDEAIRVRYGERVRIKYVNTTMMAHPMHLHGMFVELENGQTERMPKKHVVIVPPGKEVSVILTADEPGEWPFHCHLLYHMEAGMMTRFIVGPKDERKAAAQ
ncbi:MAG: copper-resistance protein CopA family [Alphaproteobacteria bacterium]|nr:copper-resistance protein CopA family [Alphaproteobacteria bacterium]